MCRLDLFRDRGRRSHPILAYWLPYHQDVAPELVLDGTRRGDPQFFFTAELSGCRLEIGRSPTPRICHIPGVITQSYLKQHKHATTEQFMDDTADRLFGPERRRKYSVNSGYGRERWATVVGVKVIGGWAFYAQVRGSFFAERRLIYTRQI